MYQIYPLFIVVAGFALAAVLSERAIARMQPGAKAALVDASARTRLFGIPVVAAFLGLILWRPLFGWVFLAVAYAALACRSILIVERMKLPAPLGRRLQAGHLIAAGCIIVCACIYASRALG